MKDNSLRPDRISLHANSGGRRASVDADPNLDRDLDGAAGEHLRDSDASPFSETAPGRTAAEQDIIDRVEARRQASTRMPRWRFVREGGGYGVVPVMADRALAEAMSLDALGLASQQELSNVFSSLVKEASNDGDVDEAKFTRLLSYVASLHPRDPNEAMLGVQMAIVHEAITGLGKAIERAVSTDQVDAMTNALAKLTRVFTQQMAAMKQHRSGGQQTIIIKKMEVNDGGNALVGAVGRGDDSRAVVAGNDDVDITPPFKQKDKRSRPALTGPSEEERLGVPFGKVVEHTARPLDAQVRVDEPAPPPSNDAQVKRRPISDVNRQEYLEKLRRWRPARRNKP